MIDKMRIVSIHYITKQDGLFQTPEPKNIPIFGSFPLAPPPPPPVN